MVESTKADERFDGTQQRQVHPPARRGCHGWRASRNLGAMNLDDASAAATATIETDGTQRPDGAEGHDPNTPENLKAFMTDRWAPSTSTVTGPAATAPSCAARRARLSALFPGEWLVVPTGTLKVRSNDTDHPFRPGTDFVWLTGSHEPDAVLVLAPTPLGAGDDGSNHRSTLHIAPRSDRSSHKFFTDRRYGELWVGARLGHDETTTLLGIACAPLADGTGPPGVGDTLKTIDQSAVRVRVLRTLDAAIDAMIQVADVDESEVPTAPPAKAEAAPPSTPPTPTKPPVRDKDKLFATALSELRLLKDPREIELLQEAVDATIRGFEDVVRELPAARATSERWIEGTFWRRARTEGNDVGYGSIVACGVHACTLHWTRNDGAVSDGDLILLDMGVEHAELYTADITRTLPVSGTFTPVQREVYDVVLAAQQAAFAATMPGADFLAPHKAAMRVITTWLVQQQILTCSVDEALDEANMYHRRYTLHGTSHMLGIDVHDCAKAREEMYRKGTLEVGTCFTIEPGLYFQPDDLSVPDRLRGIGVRIEDDVVVTADGCRILSAALPTDPDAIEAWMARLALLGPAQP